jgi:hypothetical protein
MPETGDNGTVIARSFDGSTVTHFTIDKYSRMRLVVRIPAGTVDSTKVFHPMIRLASITDAGYIPHNAKLHTVQIGQTVYGGRFDWLTGKLVAEWAVYTVTGEDQLNVFPDNPGTCNRFGVILPEALTDNTETLCSHFHLDTVRDWAYSAADVDAYYGVYRITSGYVRFILPAKTLSEAQTLLAAQYAAGTPVQIAYKLATPIEIQLTPHIISAADPEQTNALYGDGSIEVEYVKPLHVSIEERVATAVAAAMNTEGE